MSGRRSHPYQVILTKDQKPRTRNAIRSFMTSKGKNVTFPQEVMPETSYEFKISDLALIPVPLLSSQAMQSREEIVNFINKNIDSHNYRIPSQWPILKEQQGYTCGLYALAGALKYTFPEFKTPVARKRDSEDSTISLRQVAKEKNLSAFGEILDVTSFKILAEHFGFYNGKVLKVNRSSQKQYIQLICNKLINGGTLIVSCDLSDNSQPGNENGIHTHWALVFGYYFSNKKCYLLAAQYGRYYIWSADDLYYSNKNLPISNPKRKPFFYYFKNITNKSEHFVNQNKEIKENINEKRYSLENTLNNFRFTMFYVASYKPQELVQLDKIINSNTRKKGHGSE